MGESMSPAPQNTTLRGIGRRAFAVVWFASAFWTALAVLSLLEVMVRGSRIEPAAVVALSALPVVLVVRWVLSGRWRWGWGWRW
jgi:uncharacterized membrane protein YfbV (UPF0208 family)